MIRAVIASHALGKRRRGGSLCIARNSSALFAWSDRFMASPSNSRAAGNPRAQTADRQAWTGGGNADIGPKLLAMLAGAGLQDLGLNIVYPEHKEGSGKEISILTMIGISEAVLAEKLIEEQELRDVVSDLERYTRDQLSILCGPRVFQVWGRRASVYLNVAIAATEAAGINFARNRSI